MSNCHRTEKKASIADRPAGDLDVCIINLLLRELWGFPLRKTRGKLDDFRGNLDSIKKNQT